MDREEKGLVPLAKLASKIADEAIVGARGIGIRRDENRGMFSKGAMERIAAMNKSEEVEYDR